MLRARFAPVQMGHDDAGDRLALAVEDRRDDVVTPTTSCLSAIRRPAAAMAFRAGSESVPSRKTRMTWQEVEAEAGRR